MTVLRFNDGSTRRYGSDREAIVDQIARTNGPEELALLVTEATSEDGITCITGEEFAEMCWVAGRLGIVTMDEVQERRAELRNAN
jgi:hypothetical protein